MLPHNIAVDGKEPVKSLIERYPDKKEEGSLVLMD